MGQVNNTEGMKKVAVVIPIYKAKLNELEEISFKQVSRILNIYDIILVTPISLKADWLVGKRTESFSDEYFKSVQAYNRLMLDINFYQRFLAYEYILIYQLDAFVFCDRLLEMCTYGFDYIGAPWLNGVLIWDKDDLNAFQVGNGGLSLRRVISHIEVLSKNKKRLGCDNINEDIFFSMMADKGFRVASLDIALKFSFERDVRRCYRLNNNELPFGCHAWERYDIWFWKKHIEKYGYTIPEAFLENGNEDKALRAEYELKERLYYYWIYDFSFEELDKILKKYFHQQNLLLYIWGLGKYGKRLLQILNNANFKEYELVDENIAFYDEKTKKYSIKCSNIPNKNDENKNGIIISMTNKEIRESVASILLKKGYIYKRDFYFIDDIEWKVEKL